MAFYVTDKDGNEQLIAGAGRVGPRGLPGPPGPKGDTGDDGNPIGTVISFLGLTAPNGYLVCDGASYSIANYPALSAFIAAQFGSANHFGGDGTATFAVPDMRNLFLRGYHGAAGEQLSGEVGQRQEATEHANVYITASDVGNRTSGGLIGGVSPDSDSTVSRYQDRITTSNTKAFSIEPKQYNQFGVDIPAHYTARPVNMAVLYCIKAAKTVPSAPVIQVIGGNRNLLDNWYFPRPINQRGQTVYTNAGSDSTLYTIDRWCTYNKAVLTVSEGEISLVFPGDQAEGTYIIGQWMEDVKQLRGKTMTLSLLTSSLSGKINLAVQFQPDYAGSIASSTTEEAGLLSVTFTVPTDAAILGLIINAYNKTSSTLVPVAMKLELGSVQTLAHQNEYGAWVLNDPPPDYATELAKCQRYLLIIPNSGADYVGIGQGIAYSATNVVIDVPIPVSMRSRPIMTMTGNYIIRGNGSSFQFNATERVCQIGNYGTNLITINMSGFSNLPINHTISLTNDNDPSAKIIFSCDM